MRSVAIIQSRYNSKRLPGKSLLKLVGKTVLQHIVERVSVAKCVDEIVVATTINEVDDLTAIEATRCGIRCFRGSEEDVLERFYRASLEYKAEVIIRITADDPLKDPAIIDEIYQKFNTGNYDYASNTIIPTFPEGIDTEIFSAAALNRAYKEATLASEREHVTPYIWKNQQLFNCINVECDRDYSKLRWTLDYAEDWIFIQQVYEELYSSRTVFTMQDVISLVEKKPWIALFNNDIVRNEGYFRSLRGD